MPPRVTATANLPCDLRFATPEAYEQLLAGTAGGSQDGGAPHSSEEAEEPPVHLFPEGGVTNGRWGMMQFSRGEGCKRWGGEESKRPAANCRDCDQADAGTSDRFCSSVVVPARFTAQCPTVLLSSSRLHSLAAARGLGGSRGPQGESPLGGICKGHPHACDQSVGAPACHQTQLMA